MNKMLRRLCLFWCLTLTLVFLVTQLSGCATNLRRIGSKKDGPPPFPVDMSRVKEPIPKCEPKSRYGNSCSYTVFGKRYFVQESSKGYCERGVASWYGMKFHQRKTSSGERFDTTTMTAAHKTLPLPTYAYVTNLDNGRRVIVKINDRGPFCDDRIIDLSYVAAVKLGVYPRGTAHVEVRAIDPRTYGRKAPSCHAARRHHNAEAMQPSMQFVQCNPAQKHGFYVQLGVFSQEQNAARTVKKASSVAHVQPCVLENATADGTEYAVHIGPFKNQTQGKQLIHKLKTAGWSSPPTMKKM